MKDKEQRDETIDPEKIENWRIYRTAIARGEIEAPTTGGKTDDNV